VCSLEFPDLENNIHQRYQNEGLSVVGVATGAFGEQASTIEDFVQQTGVTFPVVWDADTYRQWGWPAAIAPFPRQALLDENGRAVYLASEHQEGALEDAIRRELGLD
jgi:hypothetical protein